MDKEESAQDRELKNKLEELMHYIPISAMHPLIIITLSRCRQEGYNVNKFIEEYPKLKEIEDIKRISEHKIGYLIGRD